MSVYLGSNLVSPQGGIVLDSTALPKDFSELTTLPQDPASSDLLAIRSGSDTYKATFDAVKSAMLFQPIETGITDLQAYSIGDFLLVYSVTNGPVVASSSGLQLPSSLYPNVNNVSNTCAYFYSNAWKIGWMRIKQDGVLEVYDGNSSLTATQGTRFQIFYQKATT